MACLHLYQEWNIQPLWKVNGLEQYTSWKVRVPDCVFSVRIDQKVTPTCTYAHTDTCTCVCVRVCLSLLCGAVSRRVSRVVVGWVFGCGAVRCGVCVLLSIYCNEEERSVQ